MNGYIYYKDWGYVFEQQFNENINGIFDWRLEEYWELEVLAIIFMFYLIFFIVNDVCCLIIFLQGVFYMMKVLVGQCYFKVVEVDVVDFWWMFQDQDVGNF